jgi:hypothetical protein
VRVARGRRESPSQVRAVEDGVSEQDRRVGAEDITVVHHGEIVEERISNRYTASLL